MAVGGGSLWVTQLSPSAVLRYGLQTLELERRYDLDIYEVPVEPAYGYGAAWIVLGASKALLRIDALTGRAVTIPAGARPSGPAVGFGSIWSLSIDDGELWRFDGVTGQGGKVVDVGRAPFGVATGAGSVWLANNCDGIVKRIDPRNGGDSRRHRNRLLPEVAGGRWRPRLGGAPGRALGSGDLRWL